MNLRLRPLRSLRNRLALLFFAVTALALATVVFVFLPQLEAQIVDQKLGELRKSALAAAPRLEQVVGSEVTAQGVTALVRGISDHANSRVTLLGVQQSSTRAAPRFYVISDSNQSSAVTPDWRLGGDAAKRASRRSPPSVGRRATGGGSPPRGAPAGRRGEARAPPLASVGGPRRDRRGGCAALLRGPGRLGRGVLARLRRRAPGRRPRARPAARRERGGAPRGAARRLARGARHLPPCAKARNRGAQPRGGQAGRAAAGGFEGRARPPYDRLQRDAGAARAGRSRAARVHRERVARAALADLLARRLRRAAAGRAARPGHARRVPHDDGRAGGQAPEARRRPPRPLASRRRIARVQRGARRPRRPRQRRRARVQAGGREPRDRARGAPS